MTQPKFTLTYTVTNADGTFTGQRHKNTLPEIDLIIEEVKSANYGYNSRFTFDVVDNQPDEEKLYTLHIQTITPTERYSSISEPMTFEQMSILYDVRQDRLIALGAIYNNQTGIWQLGTVGYRVEWFPYRPYEPATLLIDDPDFGKIDVKVINGQYESYSDYTNRQYSWLEVDTSSDDIDNIFNHDSPIIHDTVAEVEQFISHYFVNGRYAGNSNSEDGFLAE